MQQTIEIFQDNQLPELINFAPQTSVVVAMPKEPVAHAVVLARAVLSAGHTPLITIPARRVRSADELNQLLLFMQEHDLHDVLAVGGNDVSYYEYQDSIGLLHALVNSPTVRRIYVAGHPEGVSITSPQDALDSLLAKQNIATAQAKELRIITQLCLSPQRLQQWVRSLREHGITAPLIVGLGSRSTKEELIRRLRFCEIVRNAAFAQSYDELDKLGDVYDPLPMVQMVYALSQIDSRIAGVHWYGFDGLQPLVAEIERAKQVFLGVEGKFLSDNWW